MAEKSYGRTVSGREITEAMIGDLVAEAEAGYDVDELLARRGLRGPFSRPDLVARGFIGFVPFKGIDLSRVPDRPGVYVVLRERDDRPTFLASNPAGHFKGKDPTVPLDELEDSWPDGTHCVYIGKAAAGSSGKRHLRQRIKEFRQYGDGLPVGHQGGRRIWQLAEADEYALAWLITEDRDPEDVEAALLREFVAAYGKRPIGNRTTGRRAQAE